ncbi:MAG: ATP-grasp domain-containing protein [Planctomycetaceae bacterium]|nr:ATP-grasp domain-containing protein [Planctomycetaceae bacterium]
MKPLRVVVLVHEDLVPPDSMEGYSETEILDWKTEFDVLHTLRDMGHEAHAVGLSDDLSVLRKSLRENKPHVAFNLLEEFRGVPVFDSHVVSYLVLIQQKFTGCNSRGLMLAHDKVLSKQILSYHRIPTPRFCVFPMGRAVRKPAKLSYPLFVKSATEDASHGLSQASIVRSEEELIERVRHIHDEIQTDALCEEFIEGRELYVGVLGNSQLTTFPIWELKFDRNPDKIPLIATREAKWDPEFQKQYGVMTYEAKDLAPEVARQIIQICKRTYRGLFLSGYARIDLRLTDDGRVYVLEANPNPNLSYGEDFAESAEAAGMSYEDLLNRIIRLGLRFDPQRLT